MAAIVFRDMALKDKLLRNKNRAQRENKSSKLKKLSLNNVSRSERDAEDTNKKDNVLNHIVP